MADQRPESGHGLPPDLGVLHLRETAEGGHRRGTPSGDEGRGDLPADGGRFVLRELLDPWQHPRSADAAEQADGVADHVPPGVRETVGDGFEVLADRPPQDPQELGAAVAILLLSEQIEEDVDPDGPKGSEQVGHDGSALGRVGGHQL
ncbi:MAG: hypothetical protein A2Z48_09570 [Actinobacteria bacterium RBG_19FT_COMBO_70_19]|nr:MAG: hypothetical protein A2Z48_09570 [Actinobacteria bacterium RBG_19FT_COMBO_70_19]